MSTVNNATAVSKEEIEEFNSYIEKLADLDFEEPVNDDQGFKPKSTMANYKDKYPKQYPPFSDLAKVPTPDQTVATPDVLVPETPVEDIKTEDAQEKVKKSSKRLGITWFGLNFTLVKSDSDRLKSQDAVLALTTKNVSFYFEEE